VLTAVVLAFSLFVQDLSSAHSKGVTGVAWQGSSGTLVSCGLDRAIKVFAPSS
jgi:WD40 repeat protein